MLAALRNQGFTVSEEKAKIAVEATLAKCAPRRPPKDTTLAGLWDRLDDVSATAERLGFDDVRTSAWGRYSAGMRIDGEAYVNVVCAGDKYWIEVGNYRTFPEKWCMPRAEVAGDRADLFLIEVLKALRDEDCSLAGAVEIVLGIGALPSRGYTYEKLAENRCYRARPA